MSGAYVIFAREAYDAVGTHAAVRLYSSTDVSLGYLAKLQGWLPLLLDGRDGLCYATPHTTKCHWTILTGLR